MLLHESQAPVRARIWLAPVFSTARTAMAPRKHIVSDKASVWLDCRVDSMRADSRISKDLPKGRIVATGIVTVCFPWATVGDGTEVRSGMSRSDAG